MKTSTVLIVAGALGVLYLATRGRASVPTTAANRAAQQRFDANAANFRSVLFGSVPDNFWV